MKKRNLFGMIALTAMLAIALVLVACNSNSAMPPDPYTKYTVTFSVIGENGTLSAAVGETPITSGGEVLAGNALIFTAAPASGYRVKEWRRNGAVVDGNTSNVLEYTLAGNLNVTVEFEAIWGPTDDISGEFTCPEFLRVIREIINIPTGPFTRNDVAFIDDLYLGDWYLSLSSLAGIEHLVNLMFLDASYSSLPYVDLRYNTRLIMLVLNNNNLTSLNLSDNPNLRAFTAHNNPLTTIDLSNNTELRELGLSGTDMLVLDLSANINLMLVAANNNPNLTTVIWPENPAELLSLGMVDSALTSFTLTNAPNLIGLNISGNNISKLTLTNNPSLWFIEAGGNSLSSTKDIDFTGSDALLVVFLYANQFTEFHGSVLPPGVTELWLWQNKLEIVDFSTNTALEFLAVAGNNLTSLGLSAAHIHLGHLAAGGNQLSGHLDFSYLPNLHTLFLQHNYITSMNIQGTRIGEVESRWGPVLWVEGNNMKTLHDVDGWKEQDNLFPGTNFYFFPQRNAVASPPNILTTTIPAATVDGHFRFFFESDSQIMPTWSIEWPHAEESGLTLWRHRGELSGTIELTPGDWEFYIIVTNAQGSDRRGFTLTVDP